MIPPSNSLARALMVVAADDDHGLVLVAQLTRSPNALLAHALADALFAAVPLDSAAPQLYNLHTDTDTVRLPLVITPAGHTHRQVGS